VLLSTTEEVPGYEVVEVLGLVRGNTVRARNIGRDFTAFARNLVGGEVKAYTQLLNEAREEAMQRLAQEARSLGADAVIGLRFGTSSVMQGAAEILVYGTAVKLAPRSAAVSRQAEVRAP
jgi:uncharacterized protein YbjQ (UPF0145 family)